MQTLLQDLRYGARMLMKNPGFTLTAVLSLALGIGACTAIYSVVHAAFFARYPIEKPDDLLRLYGEDRGRNLQQLNLSVPKFQFVRAQQTAFSGLGAASYNNFTLLDRGEPAQINGAFATADFLQTFGVSPILGRFFAPAEEEGGAVAVLSETLWRGRFNADPTVIGRGLNLSGVAYTVVGIAPRLPAFWQAEVWVTEPFQLPGMSREVLQRGVSFLAVVGRMKPGVTAESAAQELAVIAGRYRADNADKADAGWNLVTSPMREDIVGTARSPLLTLLAAVGLVLLLACANVANLLLVRFADRRREIALRQALGASRAGIVRQFLLESLMVSVLAGGLGLLLAVWCLPAIIRLVEDFVTFSGDIQINLPVLGATLGVALLTGLLIGAYPAAQASKAHLTDALREGGRGMTGQRGQRRVRDWLVGGQVAVSLVLLVGAALLAATFLQLQRQPTGFRAEGVFTANITLPPSRYPDAGAQGRFFLRLSEELRQTPGVVGAALVQGLPLTNNNSRAPYARADGAPPLKDRPLGLTRSVTPGYFETLGIPIVAGRDFTERDAGDAPLVAVLSRSTAEKLFPREDPIGRRIVMGSLNGGQVMEVVGVVGDVRSRTLAQVADVEFYRPVTQRPSTFMQLAVRTSADPAVAAAAVSGTLKRLDAELPLNNPTTLAETVAQSLGQQRLLFTLLGVFAALALILAAVGIYSVVAYTVGQRTAEIGVRLTLGAPRGAILRLVLGQGLRPVGLGIGAGLVGCLALGRFVQSQLFGVSAFDPLTLAATCAGLAAVAALACLLPARRAMNVDPMIALRYD
jgi:predicted permease